MMHKNHYQILKNIHDPSVSLTFLESKGWNKIEPILYELLRCSAGIRLTAVLDVKILADRRGNILGHVQPM